MSLKNLIRTLPQPYVIILIGPPLCGKSTSINNLFNDDKNAKLIKNLTTISRDEIILDLHKSNDYNTAFNTVNQKEVDTILSSQFVEANREKINVIVDMTHMGSKRRKNNLNYFSDDYYRVAVIYPFLDIEELTKRNEKRNKLENKYIPDHVLKNMIKSYQPIDMEREGFDKIISL